MINRNRVFDYIQVIELSSSAFGHLLDFAALVKYLLLGNYHFQYSLVVILLAEPLGQIWGREFRFMEFLGREK
ncbi:hypothetical protein KSP40_PGU021246 [Platanthera guangdongensis]|uniref:Uncharacterized protein n=1 Tax=Platanthera guangdongensis TaxID=2320717 RepID=A0ABR2M445_9ASPA